MCIFWSNTESLFQWLENSGVSDGFQKYITFNNWSNVTLSTVADTSELFSTNSRLNTTFKLLLNLHQGCNGRTVSVCHIRHAKFLLLKHFFWHYIPNDDFIKVAKLYSTINSVENNFLDSSHYSTTIVPWKHNQPGILFSIVFIVLYGSQSEISLLASSETFCDKSVMPFITVKISIDFFLSA